MSASADDRREADLDVEQWHTARTAHPAPFPGPRDTRAPLRIAMEAVALDNVAAHAKASLSEEVCGVLVGRVCEDDEGLHVAVSAAIRGTSVRQGSQHVTYTQETWSEIHRTLDRQFPDESIVGWYHSHPSFGVQFSDMDRFVQSNFFGAPEQFGLVIDPVSSDIAILANTPTGIVNVGTFWVNGEARACWVPPPRAAEAAGEPAAAQLRDLDSRLAQITQALDETRETVQRSTLMFGMVICTAVVVLVASKVWSLARPPFPEVPTENISTVPVPVTIDDRDVLLQMQVRSWRIPDEMNAMLTKNRELELEFAKALVDAKQSILLAYDQALADADPEQLHQLVEDARSRVRESEDALKEQSAEEQADAGKGASRLPIILLGTAILAIVMGAVALLTKGARADDRRETRGSGSH